MDRVLRRSRVADSKVVLLVTAGYEVADRSRRISQRDARQNRVVAPAVDAHVAIEVETVAAGLHVDHTRSAKSVLRRQRAGDYLDRTGDARIDQRAEAAEALRNGDTVQ